MTQTILSTLNQGRYRLLALVADEQRYSRVYRCTDLEDGSVVAIKQAKRSGLSPAQRRFADRLFQREARLLSGLHHSSLPHLRDVFVEQGVLHLVMDFIVGETLQACLDRLRLEGNACPLTRACASDCGCAMC